MQQRYRVLRLTLQVGLPANEPLYNSVGCLALPSMDVTVTFGATKRRLDIPRSVLITVHAASRLAVLSRLYKV